MARELWRPPGRIYGPDGELMGYWASRWSEFKRLFWQMFWENPSSKATLFLAGFFILLGLVFSLLGV